MMLLFVYAGKKIVNTDRTLYFNPVFRIKINLENLNIRWRILKNIKILSDITIYSVTYKIQSVS